MRDYCLNPKHPLGKHKARIFLSQLGLHRKDAELLKKEILKEIVKSDIHEEYSDQFGKRYSAELILNINNKRAVVKTIWIIKNDHVTPELVTCYVKL